MSSGYGWNYRDFCDFYEKLTLPDGRPARLEGFQRLILRSIFATGRVELLVLIPKGHAKTTLMAALAVYHLLITRNANVYIGAADKIQADEMYRFAAHFVESEPELEELAKVLRGTREIRSTRDQGFIRVLASDDSKQGGKKQGFNPTLALIDELHAHENPNLYVDMRSGLFKRKGIIVTISTAGWDLEGVLGTLRQTFLEVDDQQDSLIALDDGTVRVDDDGRLLVATKASGRSQMLEWAVRPDDNWQDMDVVKLANPASWVTIESLEDAIESLTPWTFKRYRCNLWTLNFESWLPASAWDDLYVAGARLIPAAPVFVGVDMARYRDCAAVVAVQPIEDKPATVDAWIERGSQTNPVRYEDVKGIVRTLGESFPVLGVAYDEMKFDQAAAELEGEGLPMEKFAQSNERLCPAADALRRAIVTDRALKHDGDPVLAAHIMAPVAKEVGASMFRLDKSRKNGPPIDGAVALSMAWSLATAEAPEPGAEWW